MASALGIARCALSLAYQSMYRPPTTTDFQRKLGDILAQTREAAGRGDQRIRVEHASRGLGQSGPLISAVAQHLDRLHEAAIEEAMRLVDNFAVRGLNPVELGKSAKPILETIGEEFVNRVPFLGHEALNNATEQVRTVYRGKFKKRLDGALRDIEIGFIGGQNMAMPVKDADRRAVILQRLYEERHVRSWTAFPLDPTASQEEKIIAGNICTQLQQAGLIEWKSPRQACQRVWLISRVWASMWSRVMSDPRSRSPSIVVSPLADRVTSRSGIAMCRTFT